MYPPQTLVIFVAAWLAGWCMVDRSIVDVKYKHYMLCALKMLMRSHRSEGNEGVLGKLNKEGRAHYSLLRIASAGCYVRCWPSETASFTTQHNLGSSLLPSSYKSARAAKARQAGRAASRRSSHIDTALLFTTFDIET